MYSDDKTQKISFMQHQMQPFSASKYSSSFQKVLFRTIPPTPDIFNSLEQLSVHMIHASGKRWKDNENKSFTVIIISTTN